MGEQGTVGSKFFGGGMWPALSSSEWEPTRETLHRWTQIVGKIRMAYAPALNHWWHVALYVDARGLTTSLFPTPAGGLEMAFDFIDHQLVVRRTDGATRTIGLYPRSVADFYAETTGRLAELGVSPRIVPRPVEVVDATPFAEDTHHGAYDADAAQRFWRQLLDGSRVCSAFRSSFIGKASPVHFFWGSFDLAVTRFSGRTAPRHPGGAPNCPDWVMREAYSQEVSSAGFWPGGPREGASYSYAYPEPDGYRDAVLGPTEASYDEQLGEFVLPYTAVRTAADPDGTLAAFLQTTYAAAADRAGWDRAALEVTADYWPGRRVD